MNKKLMAVTIVAAALALFFSVPSWAADWYVPGDFATIQEAIDNPNVSNGDRIIVGPGYHAGAMVTKAVEIKGEGGATINDGPVHGSGNIQGFRIIRCDGATISHLRFEVDFPIMAAWSSDITITHCTLVNPLQGISDWIGSRWEISHNEILDMRADCGGGIGIFIGDFTADPNGVEENVVSHNKITGTLHVPADDCGNYTGPGIALMADFRSGAAGAVAIANNRVVKNKVSLVSERTDLVPVVAIELTDSRGQVGVIYGNAIGFNDLRGTDQQIALNPSGLDNPVNDISRNLGENRGHGLHPSVFGPGGN